MSVQFQLAVSVLSVQFSVAVILCDYRKRLCEARSNLLVWNTKSSRLRSNGQDFSQVTERSRSDKAACCEFSVGSTSFQLQLYYVIIVNVFARREATCLINVSMIISYNIV